MKSVVLLLEGPLQSWGTQSRFGHRDTDREPSKSGVVGLVGAALGMRRDDTELLGRLASLEMAARVDREGTVLGDFHTAGGGQFRGEPHRVFGGKPREAVLSRRFYLMDACFVVAIGGDDGELIEQIASAVQSPRWPLFLGRRSCVPARPPFLSGPLETDPRASLRSIPWQGRRPGAVPETLRCVVEDATGRPRADIPLSFARYARAFDQRGIRDEWLTTAELPREENDASEQAHSEPSLA
jgi:CRISPR system Cascade subunit CasD